MSSRNTVIRSVNSLSLATWFGGSLMGLIALPRAAATASHGEGTHAEGSAWAAWQPVQTAAIAAQLGSGLALTVANRKRLVGQRGVARVSFIRTVMTLLAIGATVMAARTGKQLDRALRTESGAGEGGDRSSSGTVADLERRTRMLQTAVPLLTGAVIVLDSLQGEQQRPVSVLRGTAQRLVPDALIDRIPDRLPEGLTDRIPDHLPSALTDRIPDRSAITDRLPDRSAITDRLPDRSAITDRLPDVLSGRLSIG